MKKEAEASLPITWGEPHVWGAGMEPDPALLR